MIFGLTSCASIKEYEKVNINDPDMELSPRQICRFETNFQLYRERDLVVQMAEKLVEDVDVINF